MFPDLKEMFTEKQVVKKPAGAAAGGDGTGEGGEGGEKKPEKLKPIQFMNDVDSKKVSTVWCGFVHTPPSPAGAHLFAVASSGSCVQAYNMGISLSKFKKFEGGWAGLKDAITQLDLERMGGMDTGELLLLGRVNGRYFCVRSAAATPLVVIVSHCSGSAPRQPIGQGVRRQGGELFATTEAAGICARSWLLTRSSGVCVSWSCSKRRSRSSRS